MSAPGDRSSGKAKGGKQAAESGVEESEGAPRQRAHSTAAASAMAPSSTPAAQAVDLNRLLAMMQSMSQKIERMDRKASKKAKKSESDEEDEDEDDEEEEEDALESDEPVYDLSGEQEVMMHELKPMRFRAPKHLNTAKGPSLFSVPASLRPESAGPLKTKWVQVTYDTLYSVGHAIETRLLAATAFLRAGGTPETAATFVESTSEKLMDMLADALYLIDGVTSSDAAEATTAKVALAGIKTLPPIDESPLARKARKAREKAADKALLKVHRQAIESQAQAILRGASGRSADATAATAAPLDADSGAGKRWRGGRGGRWKQQQQQQQPQQQQPQQKAAQPQQTAKISGGAGQGASATSAAPAGAKHE